MKRHYPKVNKFLPLGKRLFIFFFIFINMYLGEKLMPTAVTSSLERLTDDKEFEFMVSDYLSKITGIFFQNFGRNGQSQYGLDNISTSDLSIVAQCKNKLLTNSDIIEIADKVVNEFIEYKKIKTLIIATSMSIDKNIQLFVCNLNCNHKYSFEISVHFWEDITPIIASDNNLMKKYYPSKMNQSPFLGIKDLINTFNNLLCSYDIFSFLNLDYLIDGIPLDYPTNIDCFYEELLSLLNQNVFLQNEKKYIAIKEFIIILEKLNEFLGLKFDMSPGASNYRFHSNPYENLDNIESQITAFHKELDSCFKVINEVSLFPNKLF